MIHLANNQIRDIEDKYGLPVYVFNYEEFVHNYKELESTFQDIYPNYRICYSYKTNYTPFICSLVKDLGGYAEVVSSMEYQLATRLGYEPNKIVYNGPIKGDELESHLLAGGINNIDRVEEATRICALADITEKRICTGIRVNFDIGAGYISRFGIDIQHLKEIIELLHNHGIAISGLHCHMSRARSIDSWLKRVEMMLYIVSTHHLNDLEYISLGSGMTGHMDPELKSQFPTAPTYSEYGKAAVQLFADYYRNATCKPILFTEPGTTLVSKYVDFLARVDGIKTIRGKQFILCNCSFHNLGETCQMKNLPIKLFSCGGNQEVVHDADMVGYTCLEQDILYRGYTGKISIGDYVEFGNVGGYSIVDKPPFIQPNCAMISIRNGRVEQIKRKETWDDVFNSFSI